MQWFCKVVEVWIQFKAMEWCSEFSVLLAFGKNKDEKGKDGNIESMVLCNSEQHYGDGQLELNSGALCFKDIKLETLKTLIMIQQHSISARAMKLMLFLQSVTKHVDKLKQIGDSKLHDICSVKLVDLCPVQQMHLFAYSAVLWFKVRVIYCLF